MAVPASRRMVGGLIMVVLCSLGATLAATPSHSELLRKHRLAPPESGKAIKSFPNWEFTPATPGTDLVQAIAAGGDFDGNGYADVAVGDPSFDSARGRILFFFGRSEGLRQVPDIVSEGRTDAGWGSSLRMIGDVNGDGCDDLLAGGPGDPSTGRGGPAWLVLGNPRHEFQPRAWPNGRWPFSVGDINGDGYDDIAEYAGKETLLIFQGSADGLSFSPSRTLSTPQRGSNFGSMVAGLDANGDGFSDLAIAASSFDGHFYRKSGKVFLFLGSTNGLATNHAWSAEYELPAEKGIDDVHEQMFGHGLSSAGDVNGDGFDDLVVGACFAERGDRNEGMAFLFFGSNDGLQPKPAWIAEANHPHSLFGNSLSSAFDVNGDGFDDVLVGIQQASDGQQAEGAAAIYHGSKTGLPQYPNGIIESDHTHETLGTVVSSAGDINGDGYADVLVVGPGFERTTTSGAVKHGRALVCYGSRAGLPFHHRWSLKKPLLLSIQQRLDRYHRNLGSIVYWGPVAIAFCAMAAGFLAVQARLRKRIRKLVAENEQLIRAQERTRIARDIHDHLGADLTQIALQAKSTATRLSEPVGVLALQPIIDSSTRALETMDQLIWLTDPRHDTLESLLAEIGGFATRFLGEAAIQCKIDFPVDVSDRRLSAGCRHDLLSAAKELTRNVVKHSGATRVTLRATISAADFRLEVADNGCGLPPQTRGHGNGGGRGLANIATRLHAHEGTFHTASEPGAGVTFTLSVPLRP